MIVTDNSAQLYHLFLFGGFGFLLGAYYDVFRLWRTIVHTGKFAVFIQDIVFSLSSAVAFFLTALAVTGGILRWYLFAGTALGFAAYRATVGLVLVRCVRTSLRALRRAGRWIWRVVGAPFRLVLRLLKVPCYAVVRFFAKIGQKFHDFFKKVLKSRGVVLYTKLRLLDFPARRTSRRKEMPISDEHRIPQEEKKHLPTHRARNFRHLRRSGVGSVTHST